MRAPRFARPLLPAALVLLTGALTACSDSPATSQAPGALPAVAVAAEPTGRPPGNTPPAGPSTATRADVDRAETETRTGGAIRSRAIEPSRTAAAPLTEKVTWRGVTFSTPKGWTIEEVPEPDLLSEASTAYLGGPGGWFYVLRPDDPRKRLNESQEGAGLGTPYDGPCGSANNGSMTWTEKVSPRGLVSYYTEFSCTWGRGTTPSITPQWTYPENGGLVLLSDRPNATERRVAESVRF